MLQRDQVTSQPVHSFWQATSLSIFIPHPLIIQITKKAPSFAYIFISLAHNGRLLGYTRAFNQGHARKFAGNDREQNTHEGKKEQLRFFRRV